MAHIHRLIFLLAFCAVGSVFAAIPPVGGYKVTGSPDSVARGTYSEACSAYVAYMQAQQPSKNYRNPESLNPQGYGCRFLYDNPGPTQNVLAFVSVANVCPANSSLVGGGCQCNSGYVQNAASTACELPPDPCVGLKGQYAGNWWKDQGDSNGLPMKVGFSVCDRYNSTGGGLCVLTVGNGPDTLCAQASGGYWQCNGPGYYTGTRAVDASKCTVGASAGTGGSPSDPAPASPPVSENPPVPPATPAPGTAAPAPCAPGKAPGEFNGSRICAPVGSDVPTASGTGSSTTTTNNSDGSSTTTTSSGSTRCANGECTSTTNNTNVTVNGPGNDTCPAGKAVGTTTVGGQTRTTCTGTTTGTSTQPQATFCKDNPKDKQCGGDGADTAFGGTCAGGFKAVSDDAVINAMAEETFRQNCKLNPDEASQQLGKDEAAKTGNQTGSNPNNGSVAIGAGSFDSSDALGVGSGCIADKSITVMGASISLPFSMICQYLEALGLVMVGISSLLALRIVTRG